MPLQGPLVSVLIPSYNHEIYLEEAIRSVWRQSYTNVEIVVVDDCSTDLSWTLIEKLSEQSPLPMAIHRNAANIGIPGTLDRILSLAGGELSTFLASDDLLTDDRFSRSVDLFLGDPQLQAVYANGRTLCEGRVGQRIHRAHALKMLRSTPERVVHALHTDSSPLFIQAALFRTARLKALGCFDSGGLADDWLLNARFFESVRSSCEYVYLDQDVVLYRQHGSNVHKDFERHEKLKLEFVERHTPEEMKPEGFSNIFYWIAVQRLKRGDFDSALTFYRRGQASRFRLKRLVFVARWIWAWLFARIVRAESDSGS